jgi:hypothetical protein
VNKMDLEVRNVFCFCCFGRGRDVRGTVAFQAQVLA